MPRRPDSEPDLSNDEEEEGQEQETEEEEEQEEAPASRPAPKKRKKPRLVGARSGPNKTRESRFENTDGDLLWAEICDKLGQPGDLENLTAEDIEVRVAPADDISRVVANVNGGAVKGKPDGNGGTEYPGTALREWLTEVHCAYTNGPQRWSVMFVRRKGGYKTLTRGSISLPSPQQIQALRRVASARAAAEGAPPAPLDAALPWPPPIPPAAGFGAPAPGYSAQGYPPQPPPGYGPPPPYSTSPEFARLSADVARLSGGLEAVVNALREGRAPPPVPAVAQPPSSSEEELITRVLTRLYGTLPREPVGLGAPAPAAPPPAAASIVPAVPQTPQAMAAQMGEQVGALKVVMDSFRQFESMRGQLGRLLGVETPGAGESEVIEAPEAEAASKPAPMPFITSEVPMSHFLDGKPFVMARDAKTGDINWQGTLLANPRFMEKIVDHVGPAVARAIESAPAAIQRLAGGGGLVEEPVPAATAPPTVGAAPADPNAPLPPPRTAWPTV